MTEKQSQDPLALQLLFESQDCEYLWDDQSDRRSNHKPQAAKLIVITNCMLLFNLYLLDLFLQWHAVTIEFTVYLDLHTKCSM